MTLRILALRLAYVRRCSVASRRAAHRELGFETAFGSGVGFAGFPRMSGAQ
jgi:hypothetical protein